MREIKFRAWNTDDEEMYPVVSVNYEDGTCEVKGDALGLTWRDGGIRAEQECILMQFTGLKDKNGKEINEGDILKRSGDILSVHFGTLGFGVSVHRDGFSFANDWELSGGDEKGEIIGNIYQNPELLSA